MTQQLSRHWFIWENENGPAALRFDTIVGFESMENGEITLFTTNPDTDVQLRQHQVEAFLEHFRNAVAAEL